VFCAISIVAFTYNQLSVVINPAFKKYGLILLIDLIFAGIIYLTYQRTKTAYIISIVLSSIMTILFILAA
jgi:hypothetical protein